MFQTTRVESLAYGRWRAALSRIRGGTRQTEKLAAFRKESVAETCLQGTKESSVANACAGLALEAKR